MSALNVIVLPDRVHVITDGAVIDERTGLLVGVAHKVIPIPHLPAIFAFRGPIGIVGPFADTAVQLAQSYDGLRERYADHLRNEGEAVLREAGRRIDVLVAGWSAKRARFEAFMFDSHGDHPGTPPAWTPWDVEGAVMTPQSAWLERHIFPALLGGSFNIDQIAGQIITIQRMEPIDMVGVSAANVGVFAQLTTLSRAGIVTRLVARWPKDAVGEQLGQA